ncbi:hypothetical protein ACFV2N_03645 [Streptomyces sp. NPDC059680]|uniref:nSTAND1 domain-containing NTPase n=1 Tax=Streptomyces sp. NPDC059680 TaxID=3346904 RepID=UPI0036ACD344
MTDPIGVLATARAHALLIGCGTYEAEGWPPVKAAEPTLEGLRSVLHRRCGMALDAITVLLDPEEPKTLLKAVGEAVSAAQGGVLLLYFVGHAAPDGNSRLQLMTKRSADPEDFTPEAAYTRVSFERVVEKVRQGDPRLKSLIAILDCCEANRGHRDIATFDSHYSYYFLGAATNDERALAPPDQRRTVFGGRIIDLLEHGAPEFGPTIRLDAFGAVLRRTTPLGTPMPKANGSAGDLLLAPNPHRGALAQEELPAGSSMIPSGVCPYPGLAAFTEREQEWFYGRDDYVDELAFALTPVSTPRLPLILNGPSGSGKSSFIHAGLLPGLERLLPEGRATSRVTRVLEPSTARPLHGLARHLADLGQTMDVAQVESRLRSGEQGVRSVAREVMKANVASDGTLPELLLVVDQFERIFDPDTDTGERAAFIAALCALARTDIPPERRSVQVYAAEEQTRLRVLLVVQAEFATLLAESDDSLRQALTVNQYILPPFSDSDVWQAVVKPAEMEGIVPDDDFVARICADFAAAAQSPYADMTADFTPSRLLPHLAQALRATWHRQVPGRLTLEDYQSCGRLAGVISQTAEECFHQLDEPSRDIARVLLLNLVNHGGRRPFSLRTVPKETLLESAASVVDPPDRDRAASTLETLREHLLVVEDASGVTLAHLIVVTAWPRMNQWAQEEREWHIVRERIQEQARRWRDAGSDYRDFTPDIFLPDDFAEAVRRRGRSGLSPSDWEYLNATMAWWTKQEIRRRRSEIMHRFSATVAAAALLVCGAGLAYGRHQSDAAQQARSDRTAGRLVSAANSVREDHPDLAARLAAAAYRASPNPQAWSALLQTVAEARPTSVSDGLTSQLSGTQISVSDQWMATASSDGDIAVRAVAGHHQIMVLTDSRGFSAGLAFNHGGDLLAGTNGRGVVKLWNLRTPHAKPHSMVTTALGSVDPDTSFALTFSADDKLLAVAADLSEGQGEATKNGSEVWRTGGAPRPGRTASLAGSFAEFTGDANTLAVRDPKGTWGFRSVDASGGVGAVREQAAKAPLNRTSSPTSVCFSPRGGLFAQAGDATRIWATSSRVTRQITDFAAKGTSCAFSADGSMLAIFGPTTEIWNLDARHGASRTTVITTPTGETHGSTTGQFSPDGRHLAVPGAPPHAWDLTELRQPGMVAELPLTKVPGPVAIDASGTVAAIGTTDGTVALWDIHNPRKPIRRPELPAPGGALSVSTLRFAPGTERLTVTYSEGTRRTWDLAGHTATPAPTPTTPLDPDDVSASGTHGHLNVISDGPTVTLASGSDDSPLTVSVTPDSGANITALTLNPDDTLLAVGTDRGGVTLVQLNGRTVPGLAIDLPARAAPITGISFGPGDTVLIAAEDGTTLLSDLTPTSLIEQICAVPLTPQVTALWPHYASGAAASACPDN